MSTAFAYVVPVLKILEVVFVRVLDRDVLDVVADLDVDEVRVRLADVDVVLLVDVRVPLFDIVCKEQTVPSPTIVGGHTQIAVVELVVHTASL